MIKIKQNPEYDKIITNLKTFTKKLDELIEKYELYDLEGLEPLIEFSVKKNSKTLSIDPFWIALTINHPASIEEDKIISYLNEITPINATFVFYDEYEPYEEELIFEHKVILNNKNKLPNFFEENNIKGDFRLVYIPSVNETFLRRGEIRHGNPEYYSIKEVLNHFNNLFNER